MPWTNVFDRDVVGPKIRACAAEGLTIAQTAERLSMAPNTIFRIAKELKIVWQSKRGNPKRALHVRDRARPSRVAVSGPDFASAELRAEIEAAKREIAAAAPFRGGNTF